MIGLDASVPPVVAVAVLLGALLVVLLIVGTVVRGVRAGRRPRTDPGLLAADPADRPLPAVVINPTKFDGLDTVRAQISGVCHELGWKQPRFLETTQADPGFGQGLASVRAGADVVLVCGGDGTVRHVADAVAGTGVALGLLPAGTGNLLARNLELRLDDIAAATRTALTGDDRAVDLGRVRVDGAEPARPFLVMAGMGFDAAIMAGAPEELKARMGTLAYWVAGLRALRGQHVKITLAVDDLQPLQRRVRTVLVGNCGRLLGGLVLMPGAELNDGLLDVVTIAPKGLIGWFAVLARVLTRRRSGHPRVEHWQGRQVRITAEVAQQIQLDGDPSEHARELVMSVDRGALLVRVPAG